MIEEVGKQVVYIVVGATPLFVYRNYIKYKSVNQMTLILTRRTLYLDHDTWKEKGYASNLLKQDWQDRYIRYKKVINEKEKLVVDAMYDEILALPTEKGD